MMRLAVAPGPRAIAPEDRDSIEAYHRVYRQRVARLRLFNLLRELVRLVRGRLGIGQAEQGRAHHGPLGADAQVVAANVDRAFIVVAAGADWNPRRIERCIALARAASVLPVLVIAKADLARLPARTTSGGGTRPRIGSCTAWIQERS